MFNYQLSQFCNAVFVYFINTLLTKIQPLFDSNRKKPPFKTKKPRFFRKSGTFICICHSVGSAPSPVSVSGGSETVVRLVKAISGSM